MAKKTADKKETKSEFLRKVLGKNSDLDYRQVNQTWARTGHVGEISNALYYQIRRKLGIRTVWTWVQKSEPETPFGRGAASAVSTGEVYQFRITLIDSSPPIWRRIQVNDETLDQLHEHIQTAMGWTNSHLHHFKIDGKLYGDPLLIKENFDDFGYAGSTTTWLSEIVPEGGQRFTFGYEYDFGDSWEHEILFEGRMKAEPGKRCPLCVEGARACPPEDVGGVWGYANFLDALADPEHEQHDEMRNWIGRKFNSEAFKPEVATKRMIKGLPDWRKML